MACKLTYKDEVFETAEDLLEYARKNNIKEILTAFNDNNTYYQADQLKNDAKTAVLKELIDKGLVNDKPDMSNDRRYYIKDLSNRGEINQIIGKYGLRDEAKIFGDTVQFYFQPTDNTVSSRAGVKTIRKVSEFLQRIGVDVRIMNNLNINGTTLGANGVADILNKLISIAEGKEDIALTEEAMHFAVELLEQTKSPLFEKMMKNIGNYDLYRATLAQYGSIYKTKEGKPDIRKIKKEAIAKVLTEHVILNNEGSTEKPQLLAQTKTWWREFIDWLNTLIGRAGFNPFIEAAQVVTNLSGTVTGEDIFLQVGSQDIFNNLINKAAQIKKIETVNAEGGTDSHYEIGGKRVTKRVTDRSKAYEEGLFKNKQVTPEQEKQWSYKKEKGTAGHKDIENIFNRFIDPTTGFRRDVPLDKGISEIDPDNNAMYNTLETNFIERIGSFPAGTRFLSELKIYDEINDEAGTIDFIAITPDGKLNIYDWKFIDIDVKKTSDIPWYKKRAFNIQLGAYKNILSKRYGVKDYGQVRVIPIKSSYNLVGAKGSRTLKLAKVQIGSVNVKDIEQDYLLPLALEGESTGNPEIDSLLEKLNAVLHKIEVRTSNKGEQFEKVEQINTLTSAIRRLQIKGDASVLADQGLGLVRRYQDLIRRYNETFEGKDPSQISAEDQELMSEELFDAHNILDVYTDIDITLSNYIGRGKEQEELIDKLQDLSSNARYLKSKMEAVSKKLANDFIAKGVGINNLLSPEKSISYIKKMFRSFSQAHTAATRTLYKLIDPILQKTNIQFLQESKTLQSLKDKIDDWAKSKGVSNKDTFKQLMSFDSKGRWTGKLIDKVNREFYGEFDEARDAGDKKWFEENVDLDTYREWVKPYLEERKRKIKEGRYLAEDEANQKKQEQLIESVEKEFDIDKHASAYGNWRMRQLGVESKWISKEYANIKAKGNEPLLEFYNYMQDKLKKSYELGLLKAWQYRTFVPNVRTSALERMVFGGKTKSSWIERNIGANPDDQMYGHKDPLTGEVIDTIGAWYLNDLGVKSQNGDEEFIDYSDKSQDLFRVFALWNEQILKYEYLTNVENRVRLLHMTEGLKKSIATNKFGSPMRERDASGRIVADKLIEIENNEVNQGYLKGFIDYYLFGKVYTDAASLDVMIPNFVNKFAETINRKTGTTLINPIQGEGNLSLAKTIQSLNQFFQMKVLGLNVATALSNLAGGSLNSAINAGRYFTKTDLAVGFSKIGETRFWGDKESNILAGLLDKVSPLLDNIKIETARGLSVSKAVEHLSSDWLFKLQRGSDKVVQYPIAIATIMNSTIIDGQIVNIRELVRKNNGYDKIYDLAKDEREALKSKIEKEILEMKKNNSILSQAKIVNDQIELPEVSLDELAKFRSFIQQISKDSVGNSTREDINQIRLSLIGQSLMMFKNWIPRLVDVRFSELRYNVGSDTYEWGRARMFMKALSLNIFKSISRINAISSGSDKGIEFIKELYMKKKLDFEEAGEEFKMTEQEFVDMYIRGIRSELRELGILMGLFSMFLLMKANVPDDEDERAKGFWKWSTRLSDKITQELSFFYSPSSIAQIANGSLFPSLGALTDIQKIVQHVSREAFGFTIDITNIDRETGEQIQENARPLKYIFKTFPATKEALTWIAVINKDMGDSLGIQLSTESRINR